MTGADRTSPQFPPPWQVWSVLGAVYVIWGSTYLGIRVMVRDIPPLLGGGVRFTVAGLVLLAVMAARDGRDALRLTRSMAVGAIVLGLLLPGGGNGLLNIAERKIPSAFAALLYATIPLWIILLRRFAGRERIGGRVLLSVAVGFGGVAVLLLPGSRPDGVTAVGILIVLLGTISWSVGSFLSPRFAHPPSALVATGYQMLAGGLGVTVAAFAAGEGSDLRLGEIGFDSWAALVYLIVFGAIVGYSAYSWLLKHVPLTQVSTYAYVNPLVAVLLGWAILGETLSGATLIGAAVIVGSVFVIVTGGALRSSAPAPVRVRRDDGTGSGAGADRATAEPDPARAAP